MRTVSEAALRVYQYLVDRMAAGSSPSVREIGAALGIKSTSTVHRHLGELEDAGYLTREHGKMRNIVLHERGGVRVPLVGTVTAGQPILAVEQIEDFLTVPDLHRGAAGEELFALHVRGDSMIQAGILDGDIIVVRKTPTARNGEIVVALVEDEATVKRFYKENGHYRLQPENDAYEPIILDSVIILGRVIQLIRNYA